MNVDKIRALIKKNQIYDGDVILFKARKAALEVISHTGIQVVERAQLVVHLALLIRPIPRCRRYGCSPVGI